MITRAAAVRFDRRAGAGRNNPLRVSVETPDGAEHDVYLKASASPELSLSHLAAEVLAACVAGKVGLPVCRPFLVEMSAQWIATITDPDLRTMLERSNPIAFGSEAAGDGWRLWGPGEKTSTDARQTALGILAFDAFVENPDRKPSNPNLLIRRDEFRLIDHELCLRIADLIPPSQPWRLGGLAWLDRPDAHLFVGRLRRDDLDFDAVGDAWSTLEDDCLADYEASMPMEWNGVSAFVNAALSHVRTVRDRIGDCLMEVGRILG